MKVISADLTKDQQKAVERLAGDVVVSAGAGTGKTRVLTERFIHIGCTKNARVDEILAITFTEKAADEMKRRIALRFEKLGMNDEKKEVETAYISTVHSFCSRILRENPFAAGVDPEFSILDDIDKALLYDEIFEELYSEGDADLVELAELYEGESLKNGIVQYIELSRSLGRDVRHIDKQLIDPGQINKKIKKTVEDKIVSIQQNIKSLSLGLKSSEVTGAAEGKRATVVNLAEKIGNDSASPEILTQIEETISGLRSNPPKSGDPATYLKVYSVLTRIRAIIKKNESLIEFNEKLEDKLLQYKILFLDITKKFWQSYSRRKKEDGVLDYEDLQLTTRRLLQTDTSVKNEYRNRFKYILVDEFQDINWLQMDLIDLLTNNNLFVVGDVRQSIYGFRNADVEILRNLQRKTIAKNKDNCIFLNDNFRSAQNIISFINSLFSELWLEDTSAFQPLKYARNELGKDLLDPFVEFFLLSKNRSRENKGDLDELREQEARAISERLRQIVEEEKTKVYDTNLMKQRQITYGDIGVLCRSRLTYDIYSKAFNERNIPYYLVRSKSYYEKEEIIDIVNFLAIIDNPLDDPALIAVLRSRFVELTDDTLVLLRKFAQRKGIVSPYAMKSLLQISEIEMLRDEEKEKINRFLALLREIRRRKETLSLSKILDILLSKTNYVTKLLAAPDSMKKVANVNKFQEILRHYEIKKNKGIADFIRFYNTVKEKELEESEAPTETAESDSVKILTIHGAKGLEFPIVVVADMGRKFEFKHEKFAVSREFEVACDPPTEENIKSAGKILIELQTKEKELAEEKRLLYVAMTRARDRLILAGLCNFHKNYQIEDAKCFADWLRNIVFGHYDTIEEIEAYNEMDFNSTKIKLHINPQVGNESIASPRSRLIDFCSKPIRNSEKIPEADFWQPDKSTVLELRNIVKRLKLEEKTAAVQLPAHLSITDIITYNDCPYRFFLSNVLKFPEKYLFEKDYNIESRKGELTGVELGEAVHSCFEKVDLYAETDGEIDRITANLGYSAQDILKIKKMVKRFFASNVGKEVLKSPKIDREIPVKIKLGETVISGKMDLLYLNSENEWIVLDFKTNVVTDDIIDQLVEYYQLQMELYALTLHTIGERVPRKGILYFLMSNATRQIPFTEKTLRQTKSKLLDIIKAIAEQNFHSKNKSSCQKCGYYDFICPR